MAEKVINKKIVLVVDDDPILLKLYKEMFRANGIMAIAAKNGEEGLKIIKSENPDLILLDIQMPIMTGFELLRILRQEKKYKDLPVIIFTNYDLDRYRQMAKEFNVVDMFIKNEIEVATLVSKITEFLKKQEK